MSDTHLTDMPFSRLDLEPELIENLKRVGFERCTPIQAEALPLLLSGTDVAGQAQTGTGKTIAFLLATLNYLMTIPPSPERAQRHPLALIVAPTRELAVQIHKDAEQLVEGLPFRLGLVFGGVDYDKQRQELADGVDILIGTPGRLIDYYKQRVYSLRLLQVVVLDEADRMFDLGFIKDIRFLFNRMPPPQERLSMLFSATLSFRVNELAYEHMNNPVQVEIEPDQVTVEKIRQVVYHVSNDDKIALLVGLMRELQPPRSMVFVNTKWEGERVAGYLAGNGISVGLMTGDVPQRKRLKLLRQFQESEVSVLVATDVAARGLHIPDVTHVFNYDLPQDAEDYVHRIGRTARAGAEGDAISFGCETWVYSLPEIEEYIGHPIPMENIDPAWLVELRPPIQVMESDGRDAQSRNGRSGQQRRPKGSGNKSKSRGSGGKRQGNRSGNGGAQASGSRSGNSNGNVIEGGSGGNAQSRRDGGQPKARNPRRRRPRRRKPQQPGQSSGAEGATSDA